MNSPKSAEDVIILGMLEFVIESTSSQLEGELIVINDNKLLHNEMIGKWEKKGHYVSDAGGMATQIKEIISKASFSMRFKFITN